MSSRVVVFDMDGVLVDVTESYREAVQQTVENFTGTRVSRELIQEYKNAGGWNNDWELAHRLIREGGKTVPYETVVDYFNMIFLGSNGSAGLVSREEWIARPGLLENLASRFEFSIFTGRTREELTVTIARFASHLKFDPIITMDSVKEQKPSPEGLLHIARQHPGKELWYVGDTVDDARSARAAQMPFIGIAAPGNPRHRELVGLLSAEKAVAVLDDINQLEGVLPQ